MLLKNKLNAKTGVLGVVLMLMTATFILSPIPQVQAASEIKIIVNKQAITNTDISRRTALLRLQRRKGKLSTIAREELTVEALKYGELQRLRMLPSNAQVDAAFSRFASSNKLSTKQMSSVLSRAGVTAKHFKEFIRIQIGWSRALDARYGGGKNGKMSREDLVSKMLERGADKPTTTEYILQQVIFVVPQSKRSKSYIAARTRDARNFRTKFQSCDTTRGLSKGLRDVTVRNLGRFLKPELPSDWASLIAKTDVNKATTTRVTDKGVEFIGVCSSRSVSDDAAAEIVFRTEEQESSPSNEANSKKWLAELRKRSVIANR